ncbi:hypothetical protein EV401DRAFT_1946130 [Pisolithus croceorrhizus]|nr:hypothetical protein EV401DRAFT_1946130 [Pisolithus croceorrhizus]
MGASTLKTGEWRLVLRRLCLSTCIILLVEADLHENACAVGSLAHELSPNESASFSVHKPGVIPPTIRRLCLRFVPNAASPSRASK